MRCAALKMNGNFMALPWALRVVDITQNQLQRVAIESTAWMNRQRGRFVQNDNGFIFVDDANVDVHVRFQRAGLSVEVQFPGPNDVVRAYRHMIRVQQKPTVTLLTPFL